MQSDSLESGPGWRHAWSMTFKLTINRKGTYLHAILTGENTRENAQRYWDEILRECEARRCPRVLVEGRLEGARLPVGDLFQIVLELTGKARGKLEVLAYVDVNAVGNSLQFAETAAVNRGVPAVVFSTVA